ncbi:23057_t:CDS:2, partial [Gigaspora margarita]
MSKHLERDSEINDQIMSDKFFNDISSSESEIEIDSGITTCEYVTASLCSGKRFPTWEACERFLNDWAKEQGFRIVKDRVQCEGDIIRRRTFLCEHSRLYDSNSNKDTKTKKTQCPFLVNTSCPKVNNSENSIVVNKIVYEHNHPLNRELIVFEDAKKFTDSMLEDVKFMTMYCKFGATVQKKFLKGKYPIHPIYSKDLYRVIQQFRPTAKSLSNDAAQISNWLDQQKKKDPCWIIARGWDDDNTLTHLLWMKPEQALLADESLESHTWMFQQI